MSGLRRGWREHDPDDHRAEQDGELAPGRRTLTSRLGAMAGPADAGRRADLPPVPEVEQAHWRDKFGIEFDETGRVRDDASGASLPASLRDRFSAGLGADLSPVRVHTDREAGQAAASVSARAVAIGQDILFADGAYDPESHEGQHLIAHEVAHTVQQRGAAPTPQYKLAVSEPGDALEVEADRAADALVSGGTAPSLSRGDARIARDGGNKTPAGPTTFPIPVTLVPLGDRFDFTFVSPTPDKLQITATYKGPHVPTPAVAVNTVTLKPPPKGGTAPTFKPAIAARGDTEVWIDLFGDQTNVLVIKDDVTPDAVAFDKRQHKLTASVNGARVDQPSYVTIQLAAGKSAAMSRGGPGDEQTSTQTLKIGHDTFELSARRFGDSNQILLHVSAPGETATSPNILVAMPGDITALAIKVLKNDGRNVSLSLGPDKREDVHIVHTITASDTDHGQQRIHTLRTFDRDGMLLGTSSLTITGAKVDIPADQDETKSTPDLTKEWPATRPPQQGDRPGESTQVVNRPGDIFEMRIDADGDGSKELMLRLKAGNSIPGKTDKDPRTTEVRVEVVQVSSGKGSSAMVFHPIIDKLEPSMFVVADGKGPAWITLGHGYSPGGIGRFDDGLKIFPPIQTPTAWTYSIETTLEKAQVSFPPEMTPQGSLVQDDLSKIPKDTPQLGGVMFRDLMLGPYGDQFRFTLETVSAGKVVFGIAGLNEASGGGVAADGFEVVNPANARAIQPFNYQNTAASFSLGGPGFGADITIHDRLTSLTWRGVQEMPEVSRQHFLTITGRAVPDGEVTMNFVIAENRFQTKWSGSGTERDATTAALAVGGIARQAAAGSIDNVFTSMTRKAIEIRNEAADKGLISPEMKAAWDQLLDAMNALDPMTDADAAMHATDAQNARKEELRAKAAAAADSLVAQIAALTIGGDSEASASEERVNGGAGGFGYDNKYLGAHRQRFDASYEKDKGAMGLGDAIRTGHWQQAFDLFAQLRQGFDEYLASKLDKDKATELLYYGGLEREVGKVLTEGDGTPDGSPKRVWAVFVPNQMELQANKNQEQFQGGVPMQLYTWRSDGKWHLRDVTNPKKVYDDDVPAEGHATPPLELFKKLNWREHFPNGVIRYQVDGGDQGSITIDDSDWGFWDWVKAIGLALAIAGAILAFGELTIPALIAFAGSGVAGIAGSIHNMVEKADHNALDATTVVIEVANIIQSLMIVAGSLSKIVVNSARVAALEGASWTGTAAKLAGLADRAYLPIVATGNVAGATMVVAMAFDVSQQLKEIDDGGGSDESKMRSKAMLIAGWLANGVLTAIAIKGDLPILQGKAPPNLVIDILPNGRAIAHAGGVRIGGSDLAHEIPVSPTDADANAGARWQSEQFEETAHRSITPDTGAKQKAQIENAKNLLEDEKFMKWYRRWMGQDERLDLTHNPPRPKIKLAPGEKIPPEIEKQLQDFVNNSAIALYERGFKNADELRKIEEAVTKAGGRMDLDPTHPDWVKNRRAVIKALGDTSEAEKMLERYEAARGGAFVDPVKYNAEHEHLVELVPETELQKIRDLFAGYDVYVTGSATQTGKPLTKDITDVDVFVVVPADTKPDLMHAIERRAQGYEVLPNPQYLRKFNKGPNEKLSLDAKVMTPEQFFGFSTTAPVDAAGNARTPLSFHSLDRGLGNLAGPDADTVRRATNAIAEGKAAEPSDLAEIQRLVSNGDLEPASLPSSVRDKLSAPPDKVVGIENRGGPYKDARNDPSLPHEYLDRRQLLPYRRMGAVSSWKTAEKALKRGAVSVCIGNKIATADEGHALLQRLSAGDVTALHDLGVSEVPDKFDPSSREWALVEGRDGYAIYSGKIDKVSVPADVRIIGHNHPGPQPGQVEGRLIKDLPASVNGKTYGEIIADPEAAKDAAIVPSIADIHAISEGNDHVLYTRYVHEGNGRIGNPTGTAEPLVSIHLSDTKVVRWNERTKDYWYQVSVEVKDAQGNTLWSGTMWGEWHAQIQNGTVHLRTPPALQRPLPAGWKEP